MANEITVLESQEVQDGGLVTSLLMLFAIPTPIQIGGTNVVPTPATSGGDSNLPALADVILSQAEKDALDAGTSMFHITVFKRNVSLSDPAQATIVRAIYATQKIEASRRYSLRYDRAGTRINE